MAPGRSSAGVSEAYYSCGDNSSVLESEEALSPPAGEAQDTRLGGEAFSMRYVLQVAGLHGAHGGVCSTRSRGLYSGYALRLAAPRHALDQRSTPTNDGANRRPPPKLFGPNCVVGMGAELGGRIQAWGRSAVGDVSMGGWVMHQ